MDYDVCFVTGSSSLVEAGAAADSSTSGSASAGPTASRPAQWLQPTCGCTPWETASAGCPPVPAPLLNLRLVTTPFRA